MTQINISLPDDVRTYIESEVASGKFKSPGDFINEAVRHYKSQKTRNEIEDMLLEGLRSGEARLMTREDWGSIREEGRKRAGRSAS